MKSKTEIVWSIHLIKHTESKGKNAGVETKIVIVIKKGRKKYRVAHKSLAKALLEVGY